jgi:uncharacterized protein (DUF2141 family)
MLTLRPGLPRLLLLFAVLVLPSGTVAAEELGTVNVELSGLAQASGNVYISVYNSDDDWLGEDMVMQRKVVIAEALDGEVVRAALQLPPGEYALSIYYDENNNGKLDTNFIGIPREPVAISNNARPSFGPPSYEDAVFVLGAEPLVQRITMEDV